MIDSIECLLMMEKINKSRMEYLAKEYEKTQKFFEIYKRKNTPNNKLKMLGLPKRRKRK